ncbi:MAG: CbiX/SirB N-terminal domain-containing protein [Proteobacteria bacterium]|nr:CbiX/SirB N-terminal domain-containing protein [Pseudomonadota bacterium]MCH9711624.1 CbiX/SirB N-terminal domain-containing protein [Pseudomonadota bacterium]MCH9750192.1 CbiX/SirB N-terminal domain-containing protein [Pseudomonadota bacterium]
MKAILLVAHGSRKQSSNEEVKQLSLKMNQLVSNEFDLIKHAFLELAEPLIPDGIDQCVALGATDIIIVPYFLSAGRHVTEDVPEEVQKGINNNPDVNIVISDYLGENREIANLLLQSAIYTQGGRAYAT